MWEVRKRHSAQIYRMQNSAKKEDKNRNKRNKRGNYSGEEQQGQSCPSDKTHKTDHSSESNEKAKNNHICKRKWDPQQRDFGD